MRTFRGYDDGRKGQQGRQNLPGVEKPTLLPLRGGFVDVTNDLDQHQREEDGKADSGGIMVAKGSVFSGFVRLFGVFIIPFI